MSETKTTAAQLEIRVDDGSMRVPIRNMHGDEIGVFYFRPTDVGIIERYNDMIPEIDKITEPLETMSLTPDGEAADGSTDEEVAALKEARERLYAALNKMFGADMASAFFAHQSPFAPVNGKFYLEHAIDAVGAFIEQQFSIETAKMSDKVQGYVGKYTPKKRGGKK